MKKIIIVVFMLVVILLVAMSFSINSKLNILASDMGILSSYNGFTSYRTYKTISEELVTKEYEMINETKELESLVINLGLPINVSDDVLKNMSITGQYTYYNIILDLGLILVIGDSITDANSEQVDQYNSMMNTLETRYKSIDLEKLNNVFGTNTDSNILNEGVEVGINTFINQLNDETVTYFIENNTLSYKKVLTNSILNFSITSYSEKLAFYDSIYWDGDAYYASLLCNEKGSLLDSYNEENSTGTCINNLDISIEAVNVKTMEIIPNISEAPITKNSDKDN